MFGLGERANGLSDRRLGRNTIVRPSSGQESPFGKLMAGDFFTYNGRLYLKINLVDAVDVPQGTDAIFGTQQFSASCSVYVENVEIKIK